MTTSNDHGPRKSLPTLRMTPITESAAAIAGGPGDDRATSAHAAGANERPYAEYWRSIAALRGESAVQPFIEREFPEGASELELDGVSRRRFVGILGASAALAGATATAGCVRKPEENIMPFAERPEDLIPGRPIYYATAYALGGTVQGVLVESQDGRPTKIEGNPKHPGSQGATTTWAQASVLELYDPERSRAYFRGEEEVDWDTAKSGLEELRSKLQGTGGKGLAIVIDDAYSPTLQAQLEAVRQSFSGARFFVDEPGGTAHADAAAEMIAEAGARVEHHLDRAAVVLALDSDFLGTEAETTRLAREWSRNRAVEAPDDFMSRTYVVEPHLTNTGVMADHRLAMKAADVGAFLVLVLREVLGQQADNVRLPGGAEGVVDGLPTRSFDDGVAKFARVVAGDLVKNVGKCAVLVGERQPPWVHAVGYLLDATLRNHGTSLRWYAHPATVVAEPLASLAAGLQDGSIDTVLCLGTNPAYDAPGDLGIRELLAKATIVHAGLRRDETGRMAAWHFPASHYLEAWGDLQSRDGTVTICQPLIAPLHGTYSLAELAGFFATGTMVDGYSLVKGQWLASMGATFSDRSWRRWLHDGIVTGVPRPPRVPSPSNWSEIVTAAARAEAISGIEVDFHLDPKLFDGRFANNAWMQEVPHPVTKLSWDNAAYVPASLADELGVVNGDMLEITVGGRSIRIPAWVTPGQAAGTVSLNLGYGREAFGAVSQGAGFDVNPLRSAANPWFAGAEVRKAGGSYVLASTQDHGTMTPPGVLGFEFPERPIAIEANRETFKENPHFVDDANLMTKERLRHLWDPPALTGKQQWGMTVDLATCIGCNACVIACQAENNIPSVGKQQVFNGRELHWMRIDRYYRGDLNQPTAIFQPMYCQHCESAPCETVCPVAATTHSPEGLNDMAYNRCIGTRYCSNNCPYKVRRFNFFNYNLDVDPLLQMQKNPDVSVRFRGVMEKCTYCVQRIQQAKIEAHVAGRETVEDGGIVTACQQVCPTDALVFGDIADPESRVSKLKRQPRNYAVLQDLNTHPRTTYLARIRNPHPELS